MSFLLSSAQNICQSSQYAVSVLHMIGLRKKGLIIPGGSSCTAVSPDSSINHTVTFNIVSKSFKTM